MLEPVIVHLVAQLVVLVVLGHLLGELARRFGQPPVLGQLLAGIVLGPSVLGQASPDLELALFPKNDVLHALMEGLAWLGVVFLLTLTGLETDTELIKRQRQSAFAASVLGIALPFASGLGLGWIMPVDWLVSPESRLALSLFLATALSISALPVVAQILMDMGLMRRTIGQTILAAALVDDTIGWLILGFVASLFNGQSGGAPLLRAVLGTAFYALVLFTIGQRVIFTLLRWIHERLRHEEVLLAAIIVLVFTSAGITQALGTHALLGAFLMGMALRQSLEVSHLIVERIEGMTLSVLAPIFFASAGLRVVVPHLADGPHLIFFAALVSLACLGKIVGCYLGGRFGRLPHWEALALGFGMNARGAMGIIVAVLGFNLHLLTHDLFSMLVLMTVATTLMTPPLLRWALHHVVMGTDEETRLQREALVSRSYLGQVRRVLLPTRGGPDSEAAARLLGTLGLNPVRVTSLGVGAPPQAPPSTPGLDVVSKTVEHTSPIQGILDEAQAGYDLLVLGCGHQRSGLFGAVVDTLVAQSPCRVLVVRAPHGTESVPEDWPQRILLPVTGTKSSVRATELAVATARSRGTTIRILHFLEPAYWFSMEGREVGRDILDEAALLGQPYGVSMEAEVQEGTAPGAGIVAAAERMQADLIVMSAVRRSGRRLFLGSTLKHVLEHATCAIAVVVI